MKKLSLILVAISLVSLLLFSNSCGKKKGSEASSNDATKEATVDSKSRNNGFGPETQKYADVIADGSFIAVKFKDFTRESGLLEDGTLSDLLDHVDIPSNIVEKLNELIDNPGASGIDLNRDIVFSITRKNQYLVAGLSDPETFMSFMDVEDAFEPGSNGIDFVAKDMNTIIVDDLLIYAGEDEDPEDICKAIQGGNKNDDKAFREFCSSSETIALWLDMSGLPKSAKSEFKNIKGLDKSKIFASLDLRNGGIDFKLYPAFGKGFPLVNLPIKTGSQKLFKYMPDNPTVVFNGSTSRFSEFPEDLLSEIVSVVEEIGLSKDDLADIGGDFTLAVTAGSSEGQGYYSSPSPSDLSFSFAIECKEELMDGLMEDMGIEKLYGAYRFESEPPFYAFNDDDVLVIMSEDLYESSKDNIPQNNLAGSSTAGDIPRSGIAAYIDLQSQIMKDEIFKSIYQEYEPYAELIMNILNDLRCITISIDSGLNIEASILTDNENENAAKTILNWMLDIATEAERYY